jgi:hypothetical protein
MGAKVAVLTSKHEAGFCLWWVTCSPIAMAPPGDFHIVHARFGRLDTHGVSLVGTKYD